MYFKKICGKKCYLSPLDLNDTEKYTEWLNDHEVVRFMPVFSGMITALKEKETMQEISRNHNYSIISINNNELIGSCGLNSVNHLHQTAEIGIFIGNKKYWNNGYGTEAVQLLLEEFYHKNKFDINKERTNSA